LSQRPPVTFGRTVTALTKEQRQKSPAKPPRPGGGKKPRHMDGLIGAPHCGRAAYDRCRRLRLRGSGRVGRGGVGEKPCEGFAPTGPAPPNPHPLSWYPPKCRYPKRITPGNRQQSRRSPMGQEAVTMDGLTRAMPHCGTRGPHLPMPATTAAGKRAPWKRGCGATKKFTFRDITLCRGEHSGTVPPAVGQRTLKGRFPPARLLHAGGR